jgi:hypothetical protein
MTACDVPSTISGWMADPDLRRVFIRSAIGVEIDEAGAPLAEVLELTGLRLTLIDRAEEIIGGRMNFAFNDRFVLVVLEAVTRAFLELISHRGRDGWQCVMDPDCCQPEYACVSANAPSARPAAPRGGCSGPSKIAHGALGVVSLDVV